jgi:MoxR-like ATPase
MTSIYYVEPLPRIDPADSADSSAAGAGRPETYLPDPGLIAAVKVALMLGRPLLLTGEPGCGKTRLAYHLAWDLHQAPPLRFDTKSDSLAHDLFYSYDAIAHFHAAQVRKEPQALPHIQLNALGLAVLRSHPDVELERLGLLPLLAQGERSSAAGASGRAAQACVVLVDEIDKAPRDFPNDILNEVDRLCFRIPELRQRDPIAINPDPRYRPILILTSNSEKHLPDAFLRRCVYYDIPFPARGRLWDIVVAHLRATAEERRTQLAQALDFFDALRQTDTGLKKRPATAELLDWLLVLTRTCDPGRPLIEQQDRVFDSLTALIKNKEDRQAAQACWRNSQEPTRIELGGGGIAGRG